MGLFDALTGGSPQRKAMALYKRGMGKAKQKDNNGAIADYTATIHLPHAPRDIVAMALYNRALVHAAARDRESAVSDLQELLAMNDAPPSVKSAAGGKLQKLNDRDKRRDSPAD